jgi:hypothetical protein
MPADVYSGPKDEILKRRKNQEGPTVCKQFWYNLGLKNEQNRLTDVMESKTKALACPVTSTAPKGAEGV